MFQVTKELLEKLKLAITAVPLAPCGQSVVMDCAGCSGTCQGRCSGSCDNTCNTGCDCIASNGIDEW